MSPAPTIRTEYTVGKAGVVGEAEVVSFNTREKWDGTSRLIICLHGHGTPGQDLNNPLQFVQNVNFAGQAASALARTGRYIICAIQAAGSVAWSKPAALAAIDTAVAAMRTRGAKAGKYGIIGYSMGGLTAFNKLKRDAANIAAMWTWAPAVDLDYVRNTAGHVPASGNNTWQAEVDAAFGSYAASAGYRVWDEPASFRNLGVPVKVCHATDDNVIPNSISTSFVAAVNDPNITMRTPDVTGSHTALFAYVPDAEVVAFYDAANW
jgi:alpha-beta hydrolase superfamily lysophospholipase